MSTEAEHIQLREDIPSELPMTEQSRKTSSPFRPLAVVAIVIFFIIGFILIVVGQHRILNRNTNDEPSSPAERALYLMSHYPTIDTHNDLIWEIRKRANGTIYNPRTSLDLYSNLSTNIRDGQELQTDIPRLRLGKLGAQFWSVFINCNMQNTYPVQMTLEQIDTVKRMVYRYNDTFGLAYSADHIEDIFKSGRIASLIGVEGGHQINSSIGTLRLYHELGVRYMTLTHFCSTPWAQSANGPTVIPTGLTSYGVEIVREMNRIGMLVDLSHVAWSTMRATLNVTQAPIIFSHSGVAGVCNVSRNVPDDVLYKMVETDGVVQIPFINDYVACQAAKTDIDHVVAHFNYIKNLIGAQYVGIGADYDGDNGSINFPYRLDDVSTYPNLIAALIESGWTDQEVIGAMGGNLLRVMRTAEKVSQQLKYTEPPCEDRLPFNLPWPQ